MFSGSTGNLYKCYTNSTQFKIILRTFYALFDYSLVTPEYRASWITFQNLSSSPWWHSFYIFYIVLLLNCLSMMLRYYSIWPNVLLLKFCKCSIVDHKSFCRFLYCFIMRIIFHYDEKIKWSPSLCTAHNLMNDMLVSISSWYRGWSLNNCRSNISGCVNNRMNL